jgi:hypothetical protein
MAIMQGRPSFSTPRQAMFLVLLMLLLPLASQSQAFTYAPEIQEPTHTAPILVDDLPPIVCGDELCERPLRMIDRNGRDANMEYGWW